MNFNNCHNINSFRQLAKRKLPSPIFNYIDGAADDEVTYSRNTKSFEDADLVPNVLRGVENVDLTTNVFGKNISMPIYCAPTACLLYTSPSPRDLSTSRMPSSA